MVEPGTWKRILRYNQNEKHRVLLSAVHIPNLRIFKKGVIATEFTSSPPFLPQYHTAVETQLNILKVPQRLAMAAEANIVTLEAKIEAKFNELRVSGHPHDDAKKTLSYR